MSIEVPPSTEDILAAQAGSGFMSQSFGDGVTLVNRTTRLLHVKYNGRDYDIKPGRNHGFPTAMVKFAKDQNPVMGTQDLFAANRFKSLVGIEGKDDCTPIEQSAAVERIDRRTTKGKGRKAVTVEGEAIRPSEARIGGEDDDEGDASVHIDGEAASAR